MSALELASAKSRIEHLEAERITTRVILVEEINAHQAADRNWRLAEQKNLLTTRLLVQAVEALNSALTIADQMRGQRNPADPTPDILADAQAHIAALREASFHLAMQVQAAVPRK